ncbi:hypothetical protein [Flavobacterium salmonis]|uniref:Uncharacterized protein n=1 Tax=Flavobacterium salmonis TaxID=2654844 RepID=A0A6V6YSI2_9FLAO|nr:hypothetical protein [Flavobacterium salmonis]CAD0002249.1 hypothetical protein FLAT13_01004 [Flavobacterium salmonis]
MKKIIILFCICFASCSTVKIEEQIVQDFVKEKDLKKIPFLKASYLTEEAYSSNEVLDHYEMASLDKNLPLENKRREIRASISDSNTSEDKIKQLNDTSYISLDEIKQLKLLHKNDSLIYHWDAKKFKTLEIPIIKKEELLLKADKGILSISATGHVISKPIVSLNKKYALLKYFYVSLSGGSVERTYVLEKENGNWTVKQVIYIPNIY